jgi:hypothetical protein
MGTGGRERRVIIIIIIMKLFGPKKGEIKREWRKLHNEELNDLYCSSNIVSVIKTEK